jgi:hypothetical protein
MLTIKTKPDCTLGFIKAPDGYENIAMIVPEGSRFSTKSIGKLSEITEEQAREFCYKDGYSDFYYCEYKKNEINKYKSESSALMAFHTAIVLFGIAMKDFDKYLVIKL